MEAYSPPFGESASCPLTALGVGVNAEVVAIGPDTPTAQSGVWVKGLADLGFIPGARVRVIARALLGGPLAVKVGSDTFALRRLEAAQLFVRRVP
jgi:ferrous iron transport protein A